MCVLKHVEMVEIEVITIAMMAILSGKVPFIFYIIIVMMDVQKRANKNQVGYVQVVILLTGIHAWLHAVMVYLEEQKVVMTEIQLMVMVAVLFVQQNSVGNALKNLSYFHLIATKYHGLSLLIIGQQIMLLYTLNSMRLQLQAVLGLKLIGRQKQMGLFHPTNSLGL